MHFGNMGMRSNFFETQTSIIDNAIPVVVKIKTENAAREL
ncbi:hypothetical protein AU15_21600 [Marinobacter salarius]|uniref:Uncharacterized protein n=1 Tax=Marinobacter salarius TaxID=1420917 RepID=W5YW51_9GAMM|nr:hypothetical protein AU15_21600 [Marinobacter salarius]